jgi:photosystem II stability/assembly factor-like uncharacterized protein
LTRGSEGKVSGRVTCLAIHPTNPNIIYIGGADGGVWKTTNGGNSWTPLTDNQASLSLGALALDPQNPNIVYAGTGEANYSGDSYNGIGILKSADGGLTWTHIGLSNLPRIIKILVDPIDTRIVYAAGSLGVYKTTDGGNKWSPIFATALSERAHDLIFSPTSSRTLYAGIGGSQSQATGVYKSTDAGTTWTPIRNGLPSPTAIVRISLTISPATPQILYAAIHGPGARDGSDTSRVYKTTDGGANWFALSSAPDWGGDQGWYNNIIGVHPQNPDIVFVGGVQLYRSTDGGKTWINVVRSSDGSTIHVDQHAIAFFAQDPNQVVVGNDGGMYRSTNIGSTWINLNTNLALTQFYAVGTDPQNAKRSYGGTQDNGSQMGTEGNIVWDRMLGGDGGVVVVDYTNSNIIYAETQYGSHYKSTNGGQTFSSINRGIPRRGAWITPVVMDPKTPSTLYTTTTRVYKTTNSGSNWFAISDSFRSPSTIQAMAIAPTDPNTLYIGKGSTVWKTTTGGATWTKDSIGLPIRSITDITIDDRSSRTVYVTYSSYADVGHVYRTTNGGSTWQNITANLPPIPVNALVIHPDFSNILFVATDLGVFYTTNGGVLWEPLMNGFPNVVVDGIAITRDKRLRAATHGRGMYELDINTFTTDVTPNVFEMSFELSQNYPNPFNPATTIKYRVPFSGIVKLEVYDVLGRLVTTLVNEVKERGTYYTTFDAATFASGVYFYRMRAGDYSETKRMMVVR